MPSQSSIRGQDRDVRLRRRSHIVAVRMAAALECLRGLVEKAGFKPGQPRIPAGGPGGGQWTLVPGYAQGRQPGIGDNGGPLLDPPEPPKDQPKDKISKTQAGKILARQLLRRAGPLGGAIVAIEAGHWLYSEYPAIRSYQDGPKTLSELQQHVGQNRPGYEEHHIVEQGTAMREGFPLSVINSIDNRVSIPKYSHHEITAWYNTKNPEFGGLSPRQYLQGRSWAEHVRIGHRAMRKFGVLK